MENASNSRLFMLKQGRSGVVIGASGKANKSTCGLRRAEKCTARECIPREGGRSIREVRQLIHGNIKVSRWARGREVEMNAEFYDVKTRKKIKADVTEKVTYGKGGRQRYAFRAKTKDGRNLTKFVSKDVWDKAKV